MSAQAPDRHCFTMPDGSCISPYGCLHGPGDPVAFLRGAGKRLVTGSGGSRLLETVGRVLRRFAEDYDGEVITEVLVGIGPTEIHRRCGDEPRNCGCVTPYVLMAEIALEDGR